MNTLKKKSFSENSGGVPVAPEPGGYLASSQSDDDFVEVESAAPSAEPVRLFSRGHEDSSGRDVFDVVEARHVVSHNMLVRWGAWVRYRSGGGALGSVESLYERGGDGTPPSTAPLGPDPELLRMERVMLKMPRESAGIGGTRWISEGRIRVRVARVTTSPGMTLRLLYAYRWTPLTICDLLVPRLRPVAWAAHIGLHRTMCANIFRRLTL